MRNKDTLDDFCAAMRQDIADFEAFWREKNGKSPEDYPANMPIQDWLDHFMFWQDRETQ